MTDALAAADALLVETVYNERKRRGWSMRRCALAGSLSVQQWSQFEMGRQPCTEMMRLAVARAFDWDELWPIITLVDVDAMLREIDDAMARMKQARARVLELRRRLRGLGVAAPTQATDRV